MTMTKEQEESFNAAVRPVIKWICDNMHPHCHVVVTPTGAELLEGTLCTGDVFEYLKD